MTTKLAAQVRGRCSASPKDDRSAARLGGIVDGFVQCSKRFSAVRSVSPPLRLPPPPTTPKRRMRSPPRPTASRTHEHTSELQSLTRLPYAVSALSKQQYTHN